MLVQLRKSSNESGVILIIVLVILLVMATFSVGIFSQSMSQSKTSRSQVDEIVAEQLAKGVFFASYNGQNLAALTNDNRPVNQIVVYPLNGRDYTVNTSVLAAGDGLLWDVLVNVSY